MACEDSFFWMVESTREHGGGGGGKFWWGKGECGEFGRGPFFLNVGIPAARVG